MEENSEFITEKVDQIVLRLGKSSENYYLYIRVDKNFLTATNSR